MCMISNMGDTWTRTAPQIYPNIYPQVQPNVGPIKIELNPPTRFELDQLRKDLEALKKLLKAAKIYDEETGQPDCEVEEKVALIKRFAELVDVDLSEIFDE